jgi:hypothetical protein
LRLPESIFGNGNGARLVVRRYAPALRLATLITALLIGLFTSYVVYELGRYHAGFDRQAEALKRSELEVQIERLEKSNREMRTRLAEADTIRMGRAREQSEVAKALGDLQAQVARQSQELAFYRGVVAQGAAAIGVKVEQLRITVGPKPTTYVVHLALVRSGRADSMASGTVLLSLDGTADGSAKSLDFPALTAGKVHELRYNFRYLQNLDQEISVPVAFKPGQLEVEVQSSRHDVAPASQTFLWTVEPSP